MAMAMLAGVHLLHANAEAPELLPEALAEVGLPFTSRGDEAGEEYWLVAMARSVLAGAISPRELTSWAHRTFGHAGLDSAQCLVMLDDEYDDAYAMSQHYRPRPISSSDLDAEVTAEARRLVERASGGAAPTTE
jgi:hypothetical protein